MSSTNTKHGIEVYGALEAKIASGELFFIASTGKLYWQYKNGKVKEAGRVTNHGYREISITIDGKTHFVSMARFVFFLTHWRLPADGCTVDHIDRNKLNNRPSNLRELSDREQNLNQGEKSLYANSTSGYVGVSFDKAVGKWKAELSRNSKNEYIGRYSTPLEAAQAREAYIASLGGAA